ncbi:unnamed protein product [Paramecium octaurelia]|uniref:Tetratricopeptide repeat protein n=1 Tax=Paramecium octaurelia TaxID=43137 RepID=A0A8S1XU94_PAROT|nr:unnamed protein product [Paramecium octaurelia]
MQYENDRIDRDTLRRDQQLNSFLSKIREQVMKGYVVEIKTRANTQYQLENNSKQSSGLSSKSNSLINEYRLNQNEIIKDLDEIIISSERDNHQTIRLTNSFCQSPPKVKWEIMKPVVLDDHLQSDQTFLSFPSKLEMNSPLYQINKQLEEIEINQETGNCVEFIKILKKISFDLREHIKTSGDSKNQQIVNGIQMVRALCLLTRFYKQIADFPHAIRSLKKIKKFFLITDPNLIGKIQIELGKLYFLNQSYDISQKTFYEALLHYEKLQWKSEISSILLWMAKINSLTKNFESAKKMVYGAISILKDYLQEDDEQIAEAYVILGECNYLAKNQEQALEFLKKAIQMKFKKYNTYNHIRFVEVYNLVGLTYGLVPDIQQSLKYLLQALQCFQYNCVQRAQILNNIAVIYQSQGDIEKAQKCHVKAKEIYTTYLPSKHHQMERLLLNQTCLSRFQGNSQQ